MGIKQLVLALCIGLFCVPTHGVEITLWSAHESLKDLDFVTQAFEKKTGHKVNVKVFVMEAMRSELLKNANRKTFPDITLVPADFLGLHKELNLHPLDDSWGLEHINKESLGSVHLEGQYFGLPVLVGNHLLLYYNKSLVPQPAQSWADFATQYNQILKPQGKQALAWHYTSLYRFSSFLDTFQAWPIEQGNIILSSPGMVRALTAYRSVNKLDYVAQNCDSRCTVEKMKNHQVAYIISGDWEHPELSASLGDKLGVAPLPSIEGNKMKSLSTSFALAVPRHSRDNEVAKVVKEFASFFASEQVQHSLFDRFKLLPANQAALNQIKDDVHGNSKVIIEEYFNSKPMPSDYKMSIVWSILRLGYRDLTEQDFSAEEVSMRMQKLADKALGKKSAELLF